MHNYYTCEDCNFRFIKAFSISFDWIIGSSSVFYHNCDLFDSYFESFKAVGSNYLAFEGQLSFSLHLLCWYYLSIGFSFKPKVDSSKRPPYYTVTSSWNRFASRRCLAILFMDLGLTMPSLATLFTFTDHLSSDITTESHHNPCLRIRNISSFSLSI